MLMCTTCNSTTFEKYEGFMYCTQCQTQTQDYHEQEFEVAPAASKRVMKSKKRKRKQDKVELSVSDRWTSWDAFNYILYGMTVELGLLKFAPDDLESVVLKLWGCYLQKCEIAFISQTSEIMPRFGFDCIPRDSKVLYGLEQLIPWTGVKRKKKSSTSASSNTLSTATSARVMKKRIFDADYASRASQMSDALTNETIESIGRTSEIESSAEGSVSGIPLSKMMRRQDYLRYRQFKKVSRRLKSVKRPSQRSRVQHLCKMRLLAVIHLALMMMGSELQLGDLLRFIREGHLSFAKVTHFFPKDIRFSKGDVLFIESVCDEKMPTHLSQRKFGRRLARLLSVAQVPVPDMESLITRYCRELNLPDSIATYSVNVAYLMLPQEVVSLAKVYHLPNFEASGAACILFTIKLLFGLDGITELVLSDLAEKIDRGNASQKVRKHFSFTSWQKYIECRKCVISHFHYPTEEKFMCNTIGSSKKFIDMVMRESKDEFRSERFVPYKSYYMNEHVLNSVRDALNCLVQPSNCHTIDFPPSLTPLSSYLSLVLELYKERSRDLMDESRQSDGIEFPDIGPAAMEILSMDFRECDVDFVVRPDEYESTLLKSGFKIVRVGMSDLARARTEGFVIETDGEGGASQTRIDLPDLSSSSVVIFVEDPTARYWIRKPLWIVVQNTTSFEEEVLDKTAANFIWLLRELSALLEMNPREVYRELMVIEAAAKRRWTS